MTTLTSVAALRARPFSRAKRLVGVDARDRWLEHRVWATWGFLTFNVLSFSPGTSVLPIPATLGKALTQLALLAALVLALTCNKRMAIRPSIFMCIATLLALECVVTELYAQFPIGTGVRTGRFVLFVAVMWLLTPYWGRQDMLLVRSQFKTLVVIAVFQVVGLAVGPGKTLGNRFAGIIWPIPGTQVAHYMAILLGMTLILWFCREIGNKTALILAPTSAVMLVLTHTRTALLAFIAGIIVAGLSLITAMPRVRMFFTGVLVIGGTAWLALSSSITSWLARGEGSQQLSNLTGRTTFWGPLLTYPRTRFQEIFGFGMQNGSFNGLPIDSNWLLSYENQGLWGVTLCAFFVIFLYVGAAFAPRGPKRALVLFFTTYCLIASFTEDGFTDPTPYLLDIFLAASLLVPFGSMTDKARWRSSN